MTPYHTAPAATLYNAPALDVARNFDDWQPKAQGDLAGLPMFEIGGTE